MTSSRSSPSSAVFCFLSTAARVSSALTRRRRSTKQPGGLDGLGRNRTVVARRHEIKIEYLELVVPFISTISKRIRKSLYDLMGLRFLGFTSQPVLRSPMFGLKVPELKWMKCYLGGTQDVFFFFWLGEAITQRFVPQLGSQCNKAREFHRPAAAGTGRQCGPGAGGLRTA